MQLARVRTRPEVAMKVLLVEDNANLVYLMRTFFRKQPYPVQLEVVSHDFRSALFDCDRHGVDLAIIDLELGHEIDPRIGMISGLTFLRHFKERHPATCRFVSTAAEPIHEEEMELADHVLAKPYDIEEMRELMATVRHRRG